MKSKKKSCGVVVHSPAGRPRATSSGFPARSGIPRALALASPPPPAAGVSQTRRAYICYQFFKSGCSVPRLSRKHSLPIAAIEVILREGLLKKPGSNPCRPTEQSLQQVRRSISDKATPLVRIPVLQVGPFSLSRSGSDGWWLDCQGDGGMPVSADKLRCLFGEFWQREF